MKISTVTVILCVYNGENYIKKCLESLFAQTYQNMDILIVDDGSCDKTPEILKSFSKNSKIRIYQNEKNLGLMVSRNIGAATSRAEIIVYTDVDCVAPPDWIEKLVKPFATFNDVVIVGGKINDPKPSNYWELVGKGIYFLSNKSEYFHKVIGCNMALKRDFVLNNKFDETLKNYGDETNLCFHALKQGNKIFYEDSAELVHYHRNNFKSLIKQRFATGIANYYVRIKNKIFPFISVKAGVLFLTALSFAYWISGLISGIFSLILFLLYTSRVFYEDYRTSRKKIQEILYCLPGRILITAIEDLGYLWGIFWIGYIESCKR